MARQPAIDRIFSRHNTARDESAEHRRRQDIICAIDFTQAGEVPRIEVARLRIVRGGRQQHVEGRETHTPGRNPKTGIDTVMFAGTGKWDKRDHHTYVVTASDRGEPGRGVDTFTIEVRAPNGQIVFSGGGTIADGNVQSTRVKR